MLRVIPPAGTPTPLTTVIRALLRRMFGGGNQFVHQIGRLMSVKYVYAVSTGRAAQTLILRAMADLKKGERDEVVIPAYTCYTVPASVVRAGLRVRPVDIDPVTMDYKQNELEAVDLSRVLAINSSNLFGIVSSWPVISRVAGSNACYTIDDAAQSFGSANESGKSGTLGVAGFLSFGRGKNLSIYDGGVIVTNDDAIGKWLDSRVSELPRPGLGSEGIHFAAIAAYSLLLRPWLYWLPASLPFLRLGETVYNEDFLLEQLSRLQMSLGELMIGRLDALNESRTDISKQIAAALVESGQYAVAGYKPDHETVYLRLPVLAADSTARDEAIRRLRSIGVTASPMYPDIIPSLPELREHLATGLGDYPGAREVVNRLFTIPTHGYMHTQDADRVISCLLEERP